MTPAKLAQNWQSRLDRHQNGVKPNFGQPRICDPAAISLPQAAFFRRRRRRLHLLLKVRVCANNFVDPGTKVQRRVAQSGKTTFHSM